LYRLSIVSKYPNLKWSDMNYVDID